MQAAGKDISVVKEVSSLVITTEPIELAIKYEALGKVEKQGPSEELKTAKWSASRAGASEGPATMKKEPRVEEDLPEYGIDFIEVDIKQESEGIGETVRAAGAGVAACSTRDPTEECPATGTAEQPGAQHRPHASSAERPASAECMETESPDFDIEIEEMDIKQESATWLAAGAAGGPGTGLSHTQGEKRLAVPEWSSLSSYRHLKGHSAPLHKTLSHSADGENSTNQDTSLRNIFSSYVRLERCTIGSMDGKQSTYVQNELKHSPNKKHYNQCGKSFSQSGHLHNHMTVHTGEKPHTCKECGKYFSHSGYLRNHMNIHTCEKPHICQECGKSFSQSGHLHNHMNIHTGEKPHICQECGKSFSQSGHLHNHMNIHTGEKPHTCKDCGKSFAQSSNLRSHMTIHTGEKPHNCQKCGKSFSLLSTLRCHMNIHTGEKTRTCQDCGKSFSQLGHLRNHMNIHTGEKPYTSKECGKSFSQSGHLHSHMNIHTGKKPHTCQECGKSFSVARNFSSHMSIHTGEKPHT